MKNSLLVLTLLLIVLAPFSLLSQPGNDGMRVDLDANGNINDAMYFKGGQQLTHWVQTQNITQFNGEWPAQRIIDYLNQVLEVDLDISLATSICLERIGDNYLETRKDFVNTEKFYLAATSILEEMGNTTRAGYMYYYLGLLYHDFNRPAKAEEYYGKAIEVYSALPNPFQSGYSTILSRIYEKYKEQNDYHRAITYLKTFVNLIKNAAGEENEQMIVLYIQLGEDYYNAGQHQQAVDKYFKAISLKEAISGKNSSDYQDLAKVFADQFLASGLYSEAEKLYWNLLDAELQGGPEKEFEILSYLFSLYGDPFDPVKILPVMERLKPFSENGNIFFTDYSDYLEVLGTLYLMSGRYHLAEKCFLESLELIKTRIPKDFSALSDAKMNLASVYMKMYNVDQAAYYYQEALLLRELASGKVEEGFGLEMEGLIHFANKEFDKAEEVFLKKLALMPRGGFNDFGYAVGLGTLGSIYLSQEKYQAAEATFLKAIEIAENSGLNHFREFANLQGNLSLVYSRMGNYQMACFWSEKSLEGYRTIQGENHPDFHNQRGNYVMHLEAAGRFDQLRNEALAANSGLVSMVDQNLLIWSEREMEAFINLNVGNYFDAFHLIYYRLIDKYPEFGGRAYDNQLFLKGLLLQSSQKLQQAVAESNDPELKRLNERQQQVRAEMEAIYAVPAPQRTQDPARLERELDAIQKQMKQRLISLGKPINMLLAEANAFIQVKGALKADEAAIEFLSFNYYDINRQTDSVFYCALLLRPSYDYPKMIFLAEGRQLEHLIDQHPDELYGSGNTVLFQKIIAPLKPYLEGVGTLYYSPAGLLHRFSFSAIPLPDGGVLSDRYLLHNLASTRNIIAYQRPFRGETGILYGGIDYNTDASTLARLAGNYQYDALADASLGGATRNLRGSEWTYLPGTQAEAEIISQLLTQGRIYSLTLTGQEATEESFKALSGNSPSIVHIASHGFSFPPEEKEDFRREMIDSRSLQTFSIADNPLMRSGLVFSGANHTWARGNPPAGIEDGILTAYEIASLDLSNTRLVVLSACETGLGDIKGSEGVFGLQRALFMAGVQSMVVSLWEVPDMETMELMTLFYGHLVDGKPLDSAFHLAKEEMKSRYAGQPSLWAGFVLIR